MEGAMEELGFEGAPPGELPVGVRPVAGRGAGAGAPAPDVPADRSVRDRTGPVHERIAARLQAAHAAVLEAHRAIAARQLRRATGLPARPGTASVPDGRARDGDAERAGRAVEPAASDAAEAALRAAARALPAGRGPVRATVTWHDAPPPAPGPLRAEPPPGPASGSGRRRVVAGDRPVATVALPEPGEWPEEAPPACPQEPRPLARTRVTRLSPADLDALARGDAARVFGAGFDQTGLPPETLPAPWPRPGRLVEVTSVDVRPGAWPQAVVRATVRPPGPDDEGAVWVWAVLTALEVLRVHAFHQGFHLCVPGARAVPRPGGTVRVEVVDAAALDGTEAEVEAAVTRCGMVPRPYVSGNCRITVGGRVVARLRGAAVALHEGPGAEMDRVTGTTCRRTAGGRPALAHEAHVAHMAEGEPARLFGTPGERLPTARVRPRLPLGDFLLVSRVEEARGAKGAYRTGSGGGTAYDVPPDPWYVREHNGTMPQLALMETALQACGLLGGALGVSVEHPDEDLSCRNLEGTARLLRRVDPRGKTVRQRGSLRSHTPLPGGILQRYDVELLDDDGPFWTGTAVHGYFTPGLLAQQQGLDDGRYVPPWLDRHPAAPDGVLRRDLSGDTRLGRGRLALLADTVVVPRGGDHGLGYVLCDKPVDPDDWFFDHHFLHDPVLPGSVGVQTLYQAVHAFALLTGLTDGIERPVPEVAVGEEVRWSYRGQILREHRRVRAEVHLREVRRDAGRVFLRADGSVWRDDLRIYRVDGIAVDLGPAPPGRLPAGGRETGR
ncbi:3-hydroxyacyl-ACP dehydratase [Streptomyces sp. URMC 126]|uniref:3-hydroxyacyl-ACP dehydratase n=1 Tax=Streptomyces sp. URMC 126 TaxID=3423401 RepID=UPI003F1C905A